MGSGGEGCGRGGGGAGRAKEGGWATSRLCPGRAGGRAGRAGWRWRSGVKGSSRPEPWPTMRRWRGSAGTPARITQIMNLTLLAPDIQEELLFLPKVASGRDPLVLRQLQPLAAERDWAKQRKCWRELKLKQNS